MHVHGHETNGREKRMRSGVFETQGIWDPCDDSCREALSLRVGGMLRCHKTRFYLATPPEYVKPYAKVTIYATGRHLCITVDFCYNCTWVLAVPCDMPNISTGITAELLCYVTTIDIEGLQLIPCDHMPRGSTISCARYNRKTPQSHIICHRVMPLNKIVKHMPYVLFHMVWKIYGLNHMLYISYVYLLIH